MDFGWALGSMKQGLNVKRKAFSETCILRIQYPVEASLNTLPYIQMIKKVDNDYQYFPCTLSCESLLADDWILAEIF